MSKKVYYTPKQKIPQEPEVNREEVYEQLCRMAPSQFNWVIFYLRIPKISIPPPMEPQATRAQAIIDFLEKPGKAGIEGLAKAIQKSAQKSGQQGINVADLAAENSQQKRKFFAVLLSIAFLVGAFFLLRMFWPGEKVPSQQETAALLKNSDAEVAVAAEISKNALQNSIDSPQKNPQEKEVAEPSPTTHNTEENPVENTDTPKEKNLSSPNNPPQKEAVVAFFNSDNLILFRKGTDTFYPTYFSVLDQVLEVLESNEKIKIRLEGHADSDGFAAGNFQLSKRRADAVKSYLVTRGVTPSRIKSVGCGSLLPRANNKTNSGQKDNRRVEFFLQTKDNNKSCRPTDTVEE